MFKRRILYFTDMDVEVDYSAVPQGAAEGGFVPERAKAAGLEGFCEVLADTCRDALQEHGQKVKAVETETTGDWSWVTCWASFGGDAEGAAAAVQTWAAKVEQLVLTGRILRLRLQGADGTNLERCDEEYQREPMTTLESLPPEDQARIHELTKPDS